MDASAYNAHEKPPEHLRHVFKRLQKINPSAIKDDPSILDFENPNQEFPTLKKVGELSKVNILEACLSFEPDLDEATKAKLLADVQDCPIYEDENHPGLQMILGVLPLRIQTVLLSRLLHRDPLDQRHLTNVHFHHILPYDSLGNSLFSLPLNSSVECVPKDPKSHKPITIPALLQKKLRWITLGGQYDWTIKKYPMEQPPDFPRDESKLLQDLFPGTVPEAAIVNLYTPGDTLSMHRDVSEDSNKPLISVSIGCDALFVVGAGFDANGNQVNPLAVRLRSGDAVLMSASSRFAWHGVPKIVPETCPSSIENWPADDLSDNAEAYAHWKGWLKHKRINLNVRQMYD